MLSTVPDFVSKDEKVTASLIYPTQASWKTLPKTGDESSNLATGLGLLGLVSLVGLAQPKNINHRRNHFILG